MVWIDNKTADDMVPESRKINSLKTLKISAEVIEFIKETMKTCWVELTITDKKSWTKVNIQIPGRYTITITICNNDNATKPYN